MHTRQSPAKAGDCGYARPFHTIKKKKNRQQEMTANKLFFIFFLSIMISCKNSSSIFNDELAKRLTETNSMLLEMLVSNNLDVEKKDVKYLKELLRINHETSNDNLETQFNLLLDNFSKIDENYFTSIANKPEILNKFLASSKEDRLNQMNIELSKFLENIIRKSNFKTSQSEDEIFLSIIPKSFKVKPNEKFEADIIIANKVESLNGKLTLNNYSNEFRMKNGIYHFAETNSSTSDYSERKLEFKFETKISGKDTTLKIPFTYIIEK